MTDGRATAGATPRPKGPPVAEDPGTPRRVRMVAALVALAVVALAGVLYLAGGFDQRSDWVVRAPGEQVDAGNLVFALTAATAQRDDTTPEHAWVVQVSGTVRNPHAETLGPITGEYGNLFARDHGTGHVASLHSVQLGDHYSRVEVPPDGRPIDLVARFQFDEFDAGDTVQVAVATMEYTDNSVLGLGNGAKTWNTDSYERLQLVTLPLTVLPAKTG